MTKEQARQRVWKIVHSSLAYDMRRDADWLSKTPATEYRPLSKKDRERMKEAADEILAELAEKAATL